MNVYVKNIPRHISHLRNLQIKSDFNSLKMHWDICDANYSSKKSYRIHLEHFYGMNILVKILQDMQAQYLTNDPNYCIFTPPPPPFFKLNSLSLQRVLFLKSTLYDLRIFQVYIKYNLERYMLR